MRLLPDDGEFRRQGARRRCSVHEENPRWLHINGHKSDGQRNWRDHG